MRDEIEDDEQIVSEYAGYASTYGIELFCENEPQLSKTLLLDKIAANGINVQPIDGNRNSGHLHFLYPDFLIEYDEGHLPAQSLITKADKPFDLTKYESTIQQSWHFKEAAAALKRCHSSVLVTDFMASQLNYLDRFNLFLNIAVAAVEAIPCLAIHWLSSQQIISPTDFLNNVGQIPLYGAINIRFFRIAGTAGDMLMDTLGLAAFGLPDLQCHFHGLDQNRVSQVLWNTAIYIFQHGEVIESGHTVAGITPTDKWKCQYEEALVEPKRVVVDLNPGPSFAAGNRRN